ncbi:MAG: tripartite tricarboxylate transporter TctB family protein [Planctomycetota bacterium]|nr:tripartite tricarboxylate transporter TctB family protein [Planctomycetota bacterium]
MMQLMARYRDIVSGLFMLGVGGFYFYYAFFIKKFSKAFFNASMFPMILGIALIILSLAQIGYAARNIFAGSNRKDAEAARPGTPGIFRVVLTLAALFIYLLGLRDLGFLIMTCFYVLIQILILTPKGKLSLPIALVLATVFPGAVYAIFVHGFQLMLPRGILNF